MRSFDFYEFAGILVPGAVTLVALLLAAPDIVAGLKLGGLSLGDATIFMILAYAAGHLVQAVGNWIEAAWWMLRGGWPSVRALAGRGFLLSLGQYENLERRLLHDLDLNEIPRTRAGRFAIARQVHAAISKAGCAARLDIFNGNYGLSRGIAAACVVAAAAQFLASGFVYTRWLGLLVGLAAIAVFRMNRFGNVYARELFLQFLGTDSAHVIDATSLDTRRR